jgi:hypothetical protein
MTATVTLVNWPGPAPTIEEHDDPAGRWATVLHYAGIVVATLPRRPAVATSPDAGITATRPEDAMRYATVSAVDLGYAAVARADAERALRDAGTEPDWAPATVRVDGHEVPARRRTGIGGTRSLVATLPDVYLAVAASPGVALDELSFAVAPSP